MEELAKHGSWIRISQSTTIAYVTTPVNQVSTTLEFISHDDVSYQNLDHVSAAPDTGTSRVDGAVPGHS